MRFLAKLLLHLFVGNPEGRLEVKRSMTNLILEGRLALQEMQELTKSRIRFWLLAPFAWDSRNLRKPWCLFITGELACVFLFVPICIAKGLINAVSSNNLPLLIAPTLFSLVMLFLGAPTFLFLSIGEAIKGEANDYAWLRCWFVLTCYVKRKKLQSVGEIEEELTPLLEPVSPREYNQVRKKSRMLGKISLLLIFLHISGWTYLSFFNSNLSEPLRETQVAGLLYIGSLILAMTPAMFGILQENTKKPVRVVERDLYLLAEPSGNGLRISEVLKNYENEIVNKRLKDQARWFYYIGALCAWDYEKLAIVIANALLLFLYTVLNIAWTEFPNNMSVLLFRSFTVLSALLLICASVEAWLNGGGTAKALQRLAVVKLLKAGRSISSIVPFNVMLENFSRGSYNRPAKSATIEDYATRLYVNSLSRTTKKRRSRST